MSQLSLSQHNYLPLRHCKNARRPFEAARKFSRINVPTITYASSEDRSSRRDALLLTGEILQNSDGRMLNVCRAGQHFLDRYAPPQHPLFFGCAGSAILLSAGSQLLGPPAAFSDDEPEKKRIKVQYLSAIAKNSLRQAFKVRNCLSQAFQNHGDCPEEVFIIGWHEAHGHPNVHSCMHAFAGQS